MEMRADYLDRYSGLGSPIHRLPAGTKSLMALTLVALTVAMPQSRAIMLVALASLLLVTAILSQIPLHFLVQRMLWLEPFVLGVSVLSLFQPGGWRVFLLLAGKCSLCLLTMLLLSNTTPFSELLRVLQRVHVPPLLLTTLALMYRYLFVLVDETQRMRRARASRTFSAKRSWNWRTTATIISQLFLRASERSERIYAAMCARGWR
jgi:cobalt/nickel transport system permease protein